MKCPECGSPITVVDGVVQYHTTLDTLTPCTGPKAEPQAAEPKADEPKKAPRKRTTKK